MTTRTLAFIGMWEAVVLLALLAMFVLPLLAAIGMAVWALTRPKKVAPPPVKPPDSPHR